MPYRPRVLISLVLAVLLALGAGACSSSEETQPTESAVLHVRPVPPEQIDGWSAAPLQPALQAFQRSCTVLTERDPAAAMVPDRPAFGTVNDWLPACYRARALGDTSAAAARTFFIRFFRPHRLALGDRSDGLFTGYFEPQLSGAPDSSAQTPVPLHKTPPELVRMDVQRFRPDWDAETFFGHVQDGAFVPYYSRAEIVDGALHGRNLDLVWVDSRIDKFFLQIQGSGRVVFPDSSVIRVGYDAQNGHPYRAIGRDLIAMNEIPREQISLQSIRTWLQTHPDRAQAVMNRNRSYIFFRRLDVDATLGPLGAQGVPLTPEYSLAVDPRYVPYGAPVWLDARRPRVAGDASTDTATVPFQQLMIAQDTGGAIRGAIRGDVFWGAGSRARAIAGRMKSSGRVVVFLPRTLD